MKKFEANDEAYLCWVRDNPNKFILTSNKSLTDRHTTIHRSDCRLITTLQGNAKSGGFTERQYIKVWANTINELIVWLRLQKAGAEFKCCTKCNP
ncbi:hypothetical protein [Vibrio alginolyticus]|uniref:hypothetical protein n=1 Tax=Vibrio alginolyticus TaxID=663 RepID=UPI003D7CD675